MLPAPLQDAAAVSLNSERLVLLGGLDSSDTSTAAITVINEGRLSSDGRLPEAQHDAQGAEFDGATYVFGGGQFSSYDHILRYDPANGRVSVVGHLPQPASDVAVTSIGNTAYIVGGYNGERALDTILTWHGSACREKPLTEVSMNAPALKTHGTTNEKETGPESPVFSASSITLPSLLIV